MIEYHIEFVSREGDNPKGKDWDAFIVRQSELLTSLGSEGWRLLAAVPVEFAPAMTSKFVGVLMYFGREKDSSPTG